MEKFAEHLQMLTVVSTRMTEGQHLLSALQALYAGESSCGAADRQEQLAADLAQLRSSYEQLAAELQQVTAEVKARLHHWEETAECVDLLQRWLVEMTERVDAEPEPVADVAQVKARLEKLTDVQRRLESRRPDLDRTLADSRQLAASGPLEERAAALLDSWRQLQQRCQAATEQLQAEIEGFNEYNKSLHDAQKWLLQLSYQLMGQNAQYISASRPWPRSSDTRR